MPLRKRQLSPRCSKQEVKVTAFKIITSMRWWTDIRRCRQHKLSGQPLQP